MLAITGEKMAPPRAATNELKGSAPAGEDRVIQETCWARSEEITVTERKKLNGVTETCTSEIMSEVTELTVTREAEERLHSGDAVGAAHTHTQVVEDNGGELAERVETRCRQRGSEGGEGVCPLEADHDQVGPVELCEVGGGECCEWVHAELGGYGDPESACGGTNPQCDCPGEECV